MSKRDKAKAAQGIRVITLNDIRWQRCDIKATSLLANVLARAQAREEGALNLAGQYCLDNLINRLYGE